MQIAFAAAACVAALTLLGVAFDRVQRRLLVAFAALTGVAAVAAWVGFGLRPGTDDATAAGGVTVAFVAPLPAVKLRDLLRSARPCADQLAQLAQRQKQLIAEAEARIATDAERLEAESEQQRASLVRLREELARASQEAVAAGTAELEGYASERRRSLHELNERIRKRERQLLELIEREETDATRRIQAGFADVERRQLEQLERILARATSSYSDAATQQFADTVKSSREAAAVRLSRELDRAVQAFAREAQTVLADRLAQVGDAGAQRLERRQTQVAAGLDRQRSEAIAAFESRLLQAEQELRRRLDTLGADAEAERAVLDARLRELAKRIDETLART